MPFHHGGNDTGSSWNPPATTPVDPSFADPNTTSTAALISTSTSASAPASTFISTTPFDPVPTANDIASTAAHKSIGKAAFIAIITAGGTVVVAVVVACLFYFLRRRKRNSIASLKAGRPDDGEQKEDSLQAPLPINPITGSKYHYRKRPSSVASFGDMLTLPSRSPQPSMHVSEAPTEGVPLLPQ